MLPVGDEDAPDGENELETDSATFDPKASTSGSQESSGQPAAIKRSKRSTTSCNVEDALLKYLEKPRASESLALKVCTAK